ncbi:unnamed protein product [Blepharisma stoltei]|uniref:Uncharacterized protein n=1 Tax=Blepharisma stoltei TaxID=1481888 RepID=A0AAU9JMN3_9CILI|nr:unnamed protein product [Blepharisma stoltei]
MSYKPNPQSQAYMGNAAYPNAPGFNPPMPSAPSMSLDSSSPFQNQGFSRQYSNPNPFPPVVQPQVIIVSSPSTSTSSKKSRQKNQRISNSLPKASSGWEEAFCGCCSDPICCIGLIICFPPLSCCCGQISAVTRATKVSCCSPCCLNLFCCCIGFAINRGAIRKAYGIPGSFCGDCCAHLLCTLCAVSQEYREAHRRA